MSPNDEERSPTVKTRNRSHADNDPCRVTKELGEILPDFCTKEKRVPRYRFSWDNIADGLVDAIASSLRIHGDPRTELRIRYGARPNGDFVRDNWPALLDVWLAQDDQHRESLVEQLRYRGLGDPSLPVSTADEQMEYLKSCRNAPTLRRAVLTEFHALGEPPLVGKPLDKGAGPKKAPRDESLAPVTSHPEPSVSDQSLTSWVFSTLRDALDGPIEPNADGDLPIRFGSSVSYVRIDEEEQILSIFSYIVREMQSDPAVYQAVNEINLRLGFSKAVAVDDGTGVVMSALVPADFISPRGLMYVLDEVRRAADEFDTSLVHRFGGTTAAPQLGELVDV
jgi:hypothetical protein